MIAIGTLFHYCGRLRVGLCGLRQSDPEHGAELLDILESTKWYLWHGNVERALETLDNGYALASDPALHYSNQSKLIQHREDFFAHIGQGGRRHSRYSCWLFCGGILIRAKREASVSDGIQKHHHDY